MQDMMIQIMSQYGYIGILLLIAVENIFPPIPSEIWFGAAAGESWGAVTSYTDVYSAATVGVLGLTALIFGAVFVKKRFLSKKNIPGTQEDSLDLSETR
jgi:membrane protein DedA with SNARE-associated domain